MKTLSKAVVAMTGAGSGIGRALALNLAREGSELAVSDIDEDGLNETVRMIGDTVKVTKRIVDVSNRKQVYDWADAVAANHGRVDVIINNAGVGVAETIEDLTYEDFEWAFNIDFWGVVYGTKAFLPHLKRQPEGHIVNVSSINAMVPFPNNGAYNCAKAAVRSLSETLNQEFKDSSIRITCVYPGGIKTDIVRNTRFLKGPAPQSSHEDLIATFDNVARTSADKAARAIIRGIKRNRKRLLVGVDARIIDGCARLFPQGTNTLAGKLTRKVRR